MEDEFEQISGIEFPSPLDSPFGGNEIQSPPSVDPNRFLENEPTFYSSQDIGKVFFQKASEEKFWPKKNMSVYNEAGVRIPWAEYRAPKKAIPKAPPSISLDSKSQEIIGELEFPTIEITAKGYRNTPYFKIFISEDGDKLNYLASHPINGLPASNEVLIFIESDNDTFSGKLFKMRSGSGVQVEEESLSTILKAFTNAPSEDIEELMGSIYQGEQSFQTKLLTFFGDAIDLVYLAPFKLISWLLGGAIDALDFIRIKESFWNPTKKEEGKLNIKDIFDGIRSGIETARSIVNELNDLLGGTLDMVAELLNYCFDVIDKIFGVVADYLMIQFASFAGLWNGLVDLILGILFLLKLVIDGRNAAFGAVKGIGEAQANGEMEAFDNFIQSFSFGDVVDAFDTAFDNLVELVTEIDFDGILSNLGKAARRVGNAVVDALSLSIYEVAYYIGYIATFFIPFAWIVNLLGKLGKVGQLAGKAFRWVEEIMAKIFGSVLKVIGQAARPIAVILRSLTRRFRIEGAGKFFRQTIDDLFNGIRKWLDEVFPGWRKIFKTKRKYRKPTKVDIEELEKIRKLYRAGNRKNVAFTKGKIGEETIELRSRSGGKKNQKIDNFEPVPPENYRYTDGPLPDYVYHTEQKQLEYLYQKFKNNRYVPGKIEIVSDKRICDNCEYIIDRFQLDFPNIDIVRVWVRETLK